MLVNQSRTPPQIIAELLTGHAEAASLQAEASHCRALARSATANAAGMFTAAQTARLAYEERRHRLDPRRLRTFDFAAGLLILVFLGAGLALLDLLQLSGAPGITVPLPSALAAAMVWLTGAWVTALSVRERRRPTVAAASAVAVLLGLLLASLHDVGRHAALPGIAFSVFILVLTTGATVLFTRLEGASLFVARQRWHRARRACEAAARLARDDAEAAEIATQSWLGVVRTGASSVADDEHLVHETVSLALVLLADSRPRLTEASAA